MAKRHGDTSEGKRPRLYRIWVGMRERCYREAHDSFKHYGGRGIAVCEEWRSSYVAFRDWALESGYSDSKSIDRVNGDGNYEPLNCRWATDKQQARNKPRGKTKLSVELKGEMVSLFEASRRVQIGYTTLVRRYHDGLRGEALFAQPKMHTDHITRAKVLLKNGNAKLLPDEVEAIKQSLESGVELAKRYKVAQSTISMIRAGQRR